MSIILRKYRGKLAPMFQPIGASFGASAPVHSVFSWLLSPLVILALAVAFLILWSLVAPDGAHGMLAAIAVPAALAEQREEFGTKQKKVLDVVESAGRDLDFSKKDVLEKLGATDAADAVLKFRALNKEVEVLGNELSRAELKFDVAKAREREEHRSQPDDPTPRPGAFSDSGERKSFGQRFIETKDFTEWHRNRRGQMQAEVDVDLKTLFQTSAGFAPESTRTGKVVDAVTRPIQLQDLIPSSPINAAAEKYMEETTRTHAAAERSEGAAYAEDTYVYTERTSDVRSIGTSIPVTDEQLEDEAQVAGLLNQRLSFGVMQRLDGQVLIGNGTPPNLRGITQVVGIQTFAKGGDALIVAFAKALKNIRVTGRAIPNGSAFHPNDWLDTMLSQDADGRYLFGNPFQGPGPTSLFGVPAAQADALTENTVLVGDFANFCRLGVKKGVIVEVGYVGSQFTEGKRTLRATARACFTVYRPAAFCTITGY